MLKALWDNNCYYLNNLITIIDQLLVLKLNFFRVGRGCIWNFLHNLIYYRPLSPKVSEPTYRCCGLSGEIREIIYIFVNYDSDMIGWKHRSVLKKKFKGRRLSYDSNYC